MRTWEFEKPVIIVQSRNDKGWDLDDRGMGAGTGET